MGRQGSRGGPSGRTALRFRQQHDGVPVFGAEYA
ncbi:hypothetical protein ACFVIB_35160, partial [Streptomyces nigra]